MATADSASASAGSRAGSGGMPTRAQSDSYRVISRGSMYDARATDGVSPSQSATPLTLALITILAARAEVGTFAVASNSAISTVAFHVRNSLAVKCPPACSAT